jgi:hypothetical protein
VAQLEQIIVIDAPIVIDLDMIKMVRELSDKHLAAINRGRRAAGLPAIRRKKKTKEKAKMPKGYEMICHTCGKKGDLSKHNKRHKIGSQKRSY